MRYDITLLLGDYITIQKSDYVTYISRFIRRNNVENNKKKLNFQEFNYPINNRNKSFQGILFKFRRKPCNIFMPKNHSQIM